MVLAVVAARTLFPPEATASLRDDSVAAFFWVANWAFVAQKTDYFSQGSPPSPLQHTWSLGVEEQYYLFWPLLVIAVAAVFGARARWAVFALATMARGRLGRRRHPDGVRRHGEPRLLRHRHPGAGPARGRRRGRPAGARLVGADGRRHVDPHAVAAVGRRSVVGRRAGDAGGTGALRDGQRPRVPRRAADRGGGGRGPRRRTGGAGSGLTRRAGTGMAAAGVAGRHLLRRLPVALADLPGAQRGTHRMVRLAAVRAAVRGDGRGGRGLVVAARAAHPAMAAGDRPDAAAGRCHGRHRGSGDDARAAGRDQTRRRCLWVPTSTPRRWSHPRCPSR